MAGKTPTSTPSATKPVAATTNATTPTAAMTPVPSESSGMSVNVNLSVSALATIAALLSQLTDSLTLAAPEQCGRLAPRHDPQQQQYQVNTTAAALLSNVALLLQPQAQTQALNVVLQSPAPTTAPVIDATIFSPNKRLPSLTKEDENVDQQFVAHPDTKGPLTYHPSVRGEGATANIHRWWTANNASD